MTRQLNFVNYQSNGYYCVGNKIIYNTKVLKSILCDHNDAYILVRGDITITGHQPSAKQDLTDGTSIDDAEGLDLVMPI